MSATPPDEPSVETSEQPAKLHPKHWLPPHEWKAANEIADQLTETEKQARRQIVFIINDKGCTILSMTTACFRSFVKSFDATEIFLNGIFSSFACR